MGKGKNEGMKASGRMAALDDWLGEPAARFARWLASAPDISAAGLAAGDEPNAFLECAGQRFGDLASCADPGRALRELDRLLAEVPRGAMGGMGYPGSPARWFWNSASDRGFWRDLGSAGAKRSIWSGQDMEPLRLALAWLDKQEDTAASYCGKFGLAGKFKAQCLSGLLDSFSQGRLATEIFYDFLDKRQEKDGAEFCAVLGESLSGRALANWGSWAAQSEKARASGTMGMMLERLGTKARSMVLAEAEDKRLAMGMGECEFYAGIAGALRRPMVSAALGKKALQWAPAEFLAQSGAHVAASWIKTANGGQEALLAQAFARAFERLEKDGKAGQARAGLAGLFVAGSEQLGWALWRVLGWPALSPAEAQEAWEKARFSAREGAADPVDGVQKQRLFAGIEAAHMAQELEKELAQGIPARKRRPGL